MRERGHTRLPAFALIKYGNVRRRRRRSVQEKRFGLRQPAAAARAANQGRRLFRQIESKCWSP